MDQALTPEDLVFHTNVVSRMQDADMALLRAKATLLDTQALHAASRQHMDTWMQHLGTKYNLKPQDLVHADGSFTLQDPGWALEAAMEAQRQAATASPAPDVPVPEPPAPLSQDVTEGYL